MERNRIRALCALGAILALLAAVPANAATCVIHYHETLAGTTYDLYAPLPEQVDVGTYYGMEIENNWYGPDSYINNIVINPSTPLASMVELVWNDDQQTYGYAGPASFPFFGQALSFSFLVPNVPNIDIDVYYTVPGFVPPPDPPPATGDDDVTDPQLTAIFTHMSSSSAQVVASNATVVATVGSGVKMIFGGLLALVFAVTWKG